MNSIILDLDTPGGYGGLGDVVTFAWLAETSKQCDRSFIFYSLNAQKISILSLFQQRYTDICSGAVSTASFYKAELENAGNTSRLDLLKEAFNLQQFPDRRPGNSISDGTAHWAENTYANIVKRNKSFVMLFPGASYKTRQYPANYWCDIAWELSNRNISCAVFDAVYSDMFEKFPLWFHGLALEDLAALMKHADLVVGNDSFPVHLSGTLGTPTLALLGPTGPNVYKHIDNVTSVSSKLMHCTGCHFGEPFRACCDLGCQSLFRLYPENVLDKIDTILNHTHVTSPTF